MVQKRMLLVPTFSISIETFPLNHGSDIRGDNNWFGEQAYPDPNFPTVRDLFPVFM